MAEFMEFIGRKKEVTDIDNFITMTPVHAVVFVRGAGGLGKTRLLQEIHRSYAKNSEILAADIIDFDDRYLHTFEGLEIKIAQELGIETQVAKEVQELRMFRSAGAIPRFLEEQQKIITNTLSDQFNLLSTNKRVLLFFDTGEKLEENNLNRLLVLLTHFMNGIFLFAGRPQPAVDNFELMKDYFGEDAHIIDLEPLNRDESKEYLRSKLRKIHHNIKDERIQNLLTLVKGRPILIELTAQWLAMAQPPDWLLNESPSPDEDLEKKQEDFEANLVRHITKLRTPLDRLLLILSRVYPFDVEMAEEMLSLPQEVAETLIANARNYVFVKTLHGMKITLHDEMRAMVNKFVWPEIDKLDERRRRDSRRAAAIFERRVSNPEHYQHNEEDVVQSTRYSEEWRRIEREVLIEQWVDHAFYSDTDSGFDVFDEAWDSAIRNKDYVFGERVLEIANKFSNRFTEDQYLDFSVMNARQRNYTGKIGDSIQVLKKLAKRYDEEQSKLSGLYNALGRAERKSGSMKNAVDYLSKCLEIIKVTNPSRVPYVANQLGYTYRLMGDLDKAESTYKDALNLAMEAQKHDKDLIASLLNNLGYVFGIHKKYDVAENYCLQAADLWNDIGFTSQIGRVDISLGIFFRDRGNYQEAIKQFDQAIVRASGSDDFEILGLAYCHLAWAKLFKWEEINKTAILDWDDTKNKDNFIDIELLMEAKNDFDYCLTLVEKRGLGELLPSILHQMSNVYWWLGWLEDESYKLTARKYNMRSLEESEQRNNYRYAIDSLVGNAEFDYDAGNYRKIPVHAKELQSKYRRMKKQHLLYFGRMDRILGDVAFHRGKYEEALEHYTEALPEIQRHGGYGKYSVQMELLRLERKLDKLPLSEVNMWLIHFQDRWKKMAELIHWCEKEHIRARLREN
jgi:tetratricopeptide (TPR) repeat protein